MERPFFLSTERPFSLSTEGLYTRLPDSLCFFLVTLSHALINAFRNLSIYSHTTNPSLLIRVSCLCLFCFRSEQPLGAVRALHSRRSTRFMEDLSDLLANSVSLTSKEEVEIAVGGDATGSDGDDVTFDVVGRIASEKNYSSHTIQSNIERLLRPVKGVRFQFLEENRFILHFYHPLDRTHALEGSPWLIQGNALLLALITPNEDPEKMHINNMNIIVRLSNIPRQLRKPEVARKLCANIGTIVEVIPPKVRQQLII